MASTIELNFYFHYYKYITKFKLPFIQKEEDIELNEYKYNLPEEYFSYNKDKYVFPLILKSKDDEECEFLFFVNKGENKVYIGLDAFFRGVYQIIIESEEDFLITQLKKCFDKFDTFGNKYRKRLTLINTDERFIIDKESIVLNRIVSFNFDTKYSENNFYQISLIAEKDKNSNKLQKLFIIKNIQETKEEIDIRDIKANKEKLNDFMNELEKLAETETFILNYRNLKNKYKDVLNIHLPLLNKDSEYMNDFYKKNDLTDLSTLYSLLFINYILPRDILDQKLFNALLKKLKKDFEEINSNSRIGMDEKLKILSARILVYRDCETLDDLNSLVMKNIFFSDKKDNSIMDKVQKFFDKFLEDLTEESKIFSYLLQLNSGVGYCKREKVYTFDISNVDMVKNHLKSIFPKSLVIFNFHNKKISDYIAFCSIQTGGICLDENYLVDNKELKDIDYNSNDENISDEDSDEIAINIVLYMFHEYLGHKKFHHSDKGTLSPKKIIRNKKIMELKYEKEYKKNDDKSEYILSGKKKNKGDSGHFLELCYNKFNNQLIFKILCSFKNKFKLIKRPDLFNGSNDIIEKYVILRKIAEEKNITFNLENNLSIEQEINEMSQKINIEKYMEEQKEKEKFDENEKAKRKKSSSTQSKKHYYSTPTDNKKSNNNIELFEEEDNSDSYQDKNSGEEENIEDEKMMKILKKYKLKYDEELLSNIEKKFKEPGLTQKDYENLNYVYIKFMRLY